MENMSTSSPKWIFVALGVVAVLAGVGFWLLSNNNQENVPSANVTTTTRRPIAKPSQELGTPVTTIQQDETQTSLVDVDKDLETLDTTLKDADTGIAATIGPLSEN